MKKVFLILILIAFKTSLALAQSAIKVGVPTVLTGDLAVMGDNLQKTAYTYSKRYLRHPIEFIFEDAKKSGLDGFNAYKKLIEYDRVNFLIGGTCSNGTMAGAPLINKSKTVMITPLTGGSNIDSAGEYIFRIGNSDILGAHQQADIFLKNHIKRVALFTEETEYTQDIAKYFREYFVEQGGELVFDENFTPDLPTFKSTITRINSKNPEAVFIPTQSGLAFGIFIKEYKEQNPGKSLEFHTNFVAAQNPDAYKVAGEAIWGTKYLSPSYDSSSSALQKFFSEFKEDHDAAPAMPIHSAGFFDALSMLQNFLDTNESGKLSGTRLHDYLLSNVKNYNGLMGAYSFDKNGNANIGFIEAKVEGEKGTVNIN